MVAGDLLVSFHSSPSVKRVILFRSRPGGFASRRSLLLSGVAFGVHVFRRFRGGLEARRFPGGSVFVCIRRYGAELVGRPGVV